MTTSEKIKGVRERLALYYTAEKKILSGQSYTIGSRQLTRTSLAAVQSEIKTLEAELDALLTRGTTKRRQARVVPRD